MILDDIVEKTRLRVQQDKEKLPPEEMIAAARKVKNKLPEFAFEKTLATGDIGFICEVKKASPSKGLIAPDFPYVQIAKDYERSGAACISVLTEPDYFQGSNTYLTEIKQEVNLPIIRKDFVVDEYQIYQAKVIGADAVLLICAVLGEDTLKAYIKICDELGLSALVEAHDEQEIGMALRAGARMIGVNNRNLKDFTVDIHNSMRLRALVPENIIFIAESGIRTGADIEELRTAHVNGVLIGETLMRAKNKPEMLNALRGTRVKICGLKRKRDIEIVNELQPDYIGFVFWEKSSRYVTDEQAAGLRAELNDTARRKGKLQVVGVFVNDEIPHIVKLYQEGTIDLIQLHGDEDENYIRKLRETLAGSIVHPTYGQLRERITSNINQNDNGQLKEECTSSATRVDGRKGSRCILQAVRVKGAGDLERGETSTADYVLLDTFHKDTYGGTGESFEEGLILAGYRPYFLAGGISAENVKDKIRRLHPYAVDVSSSVETDGVKDEEKIRKLMMAVHEANLE